MTALAMPQAELPGALADARPVAALGYVVELDGAARLALTPDELGSMLGITGNEVRRVLIRPGLLPARNLHPGSRGGRYLIAVKAALEWLDGRDDPIPATG